MPKRRIPVHTPWSCAMHTKVQEPDWPQVLSAPASWNAWTAQLDAWLNPALHWEMGFRLGAHYKNVPRASTALASASARKKSLKCMIAQSFF